MTIVMLLIKVPIVHDPGMICFDLLAWMTFSTVYTYSHVFRLFKVRVMVYIPLSGLIFEI